MSPTNATPIDVVILGGGIAGLWSLRALLGAGYDAALLEARALGAGQTIAAQGIIHGGLKYSLGGRLTRAASAIRDMPEHWRACFEAQREPALPKDAIRAERCFLWRTGSLTSRAAMLGARAGLRIAPKTLSPEERPAILASVPGCAASLDEQVVDPARVLEALASPARERLALLAPDEPLRFEQAPTRAAASVIVHARLRDAGEIALAPAMLVIAAGSGTAPLREALGLAPRRTQRRPLHMVMLRGDMPELFGHCVDGARTRVTITTSRSRDGSVVWQVGGEVAEVGVAMDEATLIDHAKRELAACLPDLELDSCAVATHRIDRVEGRRGSGGRPEDEVALREGAVVTALPTKLALAPRLARRIVETARELVGEGAGGARAIEALAQAARPEVALPPWDVARQWR